MINIHTYIFNSQREKIAITEEKAISIANDYQVRNNGYIDGFIHITYYNHNITSEENSDDVELMWIGLLRMTLEYLENGSGETSYFMNDQTWKMERINTKPENQILFSIRNKQKKFAFEEQLFLKELLKSGEEFTKFISEISQPNSITALEPVIMKIKKLVYK